MKNSRLCLVTAAIAAVLAATTGSAIAAATDAGTKRLTCALTIDSPTMYVMVEESHVVDVCMPAGEKFDKLALGDTGRWKVETQDDGAKLLIKPLDGRIRTNLIIYVDAGSSTEKRYELRLFGTDKVVE